MPLSGCRWQLTRQRHRPAHAPWYASVWQGTAGPLLIRPHFANQKKTARRSHKARRAGREGRYRAPGRPPPVPAINDITAFVGQNEAGKSNLFEALYRI